MAHNVVETSRIRKSQDIHHHAYINQYELVAALGEGMHGRVMLARDSKTHERVAIKIMKRINPIYRKLPRSTRLTAPRPSAQQETESKIRREIAVMKKCTHQNLVRLREVIDDPASKKVYLVMENLEGGEVKWRSKSFDEPVLQLPQVQRILRDVTLGLEYLHHQGIIHRDIKPANLLWTQDRQSVKICDFGVSHFTAAAVAADQDPNLYDEAGLTKTAGSPAFFAPEICHTPNISFDDPIRLRSGSTSPTPLPTLPPITKQIDIWALGVTFYCLLFGTPPWQGQTEFAMFRAICNDDFHIPDTMCSDRVPTGGKRRSPRGKHIGWCVVGLLEGLLEKDQDRRITLDHIKRIPWIQEGVRDPGRWLRETAPDTQSRVVITDEDTKRALKTARFSYPGWVARITSTIKRVPLPLIPSSRSADPAASHAKPESLSRARSSRARAAMDRQLKRFAFGNPSPIRSSTLPASRDHRRNSIAGPPHGQSISDPSSHITSTGTRRSMAMHSTSPRTWSTRRHLESLNLPASSASLTPSPTTPDEPPLAGGSLKERISQVIRAGSVKKAVKGVTTPQSRRDKPDRPPRGRTSAETLDVLRPSEELGLTPAMRASSWGPPYATSPLDDDGGSFDRTVSEAGGPVQDFCRSVVRFGAGGYVEAPAAGVCQPMSTPGAGSSRAPPAGVSHSDSSSGGAGMTHSDSSSNSTATTTMTKQQQQHGDASRPPRVTSPLARDGESEEELSSDVFDENEPDDSSDDDVIELRSRRPSAVLSRSANASPLR